MAEHKRGPCDAIARVRRIAPYAYCTGGYEDAFDRTIYRVWNAGGVIATGISAMQAWNNAAAMLKDVPAGPDEGDVYLAGKDVQQMIGQSLRRQGR